MRFPDAMYEVLQGSRYDFLTGRRVDIRERAAEMLERFLRWVLGAFDFDLPYGEAGGFGLLTIIFTLLAVILVGMAIYFLVQAWRNSRVAARHTLSEIFSELKAHTVAELLEIAENAEVRRISVRYKYIAVILALNERGIIEIAPSDTNAIILRQIEKISPEISVGFAEVADGFHLAWFGHKNLSDEAYEKFSAAVTGVISA